MGFEPNVVKQSDRAQGILDLVAAGIGVSFVPEHFQRYQSDLVLRRLTPKTPAIPLCMVWRKNDSFSALHARVRRDLNGLMGRDVQMPNFMT